MGKIFYFIRGTLMGVPSLNDLAVEGTLNTNKQTSSEHMNAANFFRRLCRTYLKVPIKQYSYFIRTNKL